MIKPIFCREWDSVDDFQLQLNLTSDDKKQLEYKKIIVWNSSKQKYFWNIVGFVVIKNIPTIIFPELYKSDDLSLSKDDALMLLKVFKKYCNSSDLKTEEMEYLLGNNGKDESKIALSIYFFSDYKNYGLLNRFKSETKQNETGLINWSKTTTQQIPVTTHHSAFYPRPYVRQRQNNQNSIIRRIHEWILADASSKWGWLDNDFKYTMESDFPCSTPNEAVIILKKELRTTFLQREIKLIKNMIAYLTNTSDATNGLVCDYFYTPFFHNIWERLCGYAFDNNYKQLSERYIPETTIHFTNKNKKDLKRRQIPDILFLRNHAGNTIFCIFDAKYYKYEEFPGWPDIMKQYVYYMTIKEMLRQEGTDCKIINTFLLPGKVATIERCAIVQTDYMEKFGNIIAYYVNVENVMRIYLDDNKQKTLDEIFKDLNI